MNDDRLRPWRRLAITLGVVAGQFALALVSSFGVFGFLIGLFLLATATGMTQFSDLGNPSDTYAAAGKILAISASAMVGGLYGLAGLNAYKSRGEPPRRGFEVKVHDTDG